MLLKKQSNLTPSGSLFSMQGLCVCYEGTEQGVVEEVARILRISSSSCEMKKAVVIVQLAQRKDLFKLAYLGQSFSQVLELLHSFSCSALDDLSSLEKFDFSFLAGKRFRVDCVRVGDHSFRSQDLEQELGGVILEHVQAQVDLHNPEIILFVYLCEHTAYLGVDYVGFDLSKRDYNVYPHSSSIKGPLAYALLSIADYSSEKRLLDPFCLSGMIPIEAAFRATGFSLNYFRKKKFLFVKQSLVTDTFFEELDTTIPSKPLPITGVDHNLPNITASKHNAKLAGLEKVIDFRRGDTQWIDFKFEPHSIDCVIMAPPRPTGRSLVLVQKRLEELFQNLSEVMTKNAAMVILDNGMVRSLAEKYGYVLKEEHKIKKGNATMMVLVYAASFKDKK